ncbi:hypothetical protein B0H16DRAFT_1522701 [Mycena metata]|uniref:Uncharacterized protein n=1 Tax=Mycena metata TaxID=1033252 RepID=A0AAD7JKM7_9AGAR|nr:hypothetical protein B0H16DRAFT_1522701 [Mycena metata]
MWSSANVASPSVAHSGLASLTTIFVLTFSSFFFSDPHNEKDLCASSTPSLTSGTATPVVLQQQDLGFFIKCLLIMICFCVTVASGHWARSPGCRRLKREEDEAPPPPPPPPPPSPQQLFVNQNADDGEANGDSDDGDDEPQEGAGEDAQDAPAGDGHATGAAPAPEDPPPPGGLEEDDNDEGDYVRDGGLAWLVLLLIGRLLIRIVKREWTKGSEHANVKTRSATIPSLLKRQMAGTVQDLACAAPKAPSVIQGLLQRRPQPAILITEQLPDAAPLNPTPSAAASAVPSMTLRKVNRMFVWRNLYLLSAVLPGLAFLVTALRFLLPLRANNRDGEQLAVPQLALVGEQEEDAAEEADADADAGEEDDQEPVPEPPETPRLPQTPRAPPPSPVSPRRQRPLAPLPVRDTSTQETCDRMVAVLRRTTALRMVRADTASPQREEEKRKERVREIQRRIWGLMYELRVENAAVIGEDVD